MDLQRLLDRIKNGFTGRAWAAQYSILEEAPFDGQPRPTSRDGISRPTAARAPFSRYKYFAFFMLGIAMLWAWNMFLAAAPYFQSRFADNDTIVANFLPAITSATTVVNFVVIIVLARRQAQANYLRRISVSLLLTTQVFALLATSTRIFLRVSSSVYFVFTLVMVMVAALATGLCQNGTFAFAASFGRPEYMQANMVGQAVAGVLPSVAQIVSVLATDDLDRDAVQPKDGASSMAARRSAFLYFMAATTIGAVTLLCIYPLEREASHRKHTIFDRSTTSLDSERETPDKTISLMTLYRKLFWIANAVFLCFAVTMFFPVFTARILSVDSSADRSIYVQPRIFIPLGFLVWNSGDLLGRLSTSLPFSLRHRPRALFIISLLRIAFVPLYLLCNIDGNGAAIRSDAFYLVGVQFAFGLSNGWLGSSCMMAAGEWVEVEEKEATGGFMGVMLVAGLTAGSVLSFAV